jgi:Lhr-like helicase
MGHEMTKELADFLGIDTRLIKHIVDSNYKCGCSIKVSTYSNEASTLDITFCNEWRDFVSYKKREQIYLNIKEEYERLTKNLKERGLLTDD